MAGDLHAKIDNFKSRYMFEIVIFFGGGGGGGGRHLIVYYPRVIYLLVRLPSLIGLTVYSVISNSAGSDIFDYAFQNVVLFHGVSKSALSDTLV